MLLIHYYNLTHFRENDIYWTHLKVFLIIESLFYIWDIIQCTFFIYIILTARQFHFNFSLILGYIFFIHVIDNVIILLIRIHSLYGVDDRVIKEDRVFVALMFSTTITVMSAMCVMPLLIFERCFATYFLSDYETKQRRYISFCLIAIVLVIGVVSSAKCQHKENAKYAIGMLLVLNTVALLVNAFLQKYNKKQYVKYHGSKLASKQSVRYSLTRRFQISENIKSINIINMIIMYMGLMNGLVVGSLIICSTNISPESQVLCSIVLDSCIFLYSHSFPRIILCYGDKFRRRFKESFSKIGIDSTCKIDPLQDTFGAKMDDCYTLDKHFLHLRQSWG